MCPLYAPGDSNQEVQSESVEASLPPRTPAKETKLNTEHRTSQNAENGFSQQSAFSRITPAQRKKLFDVRSLMDYPISICSHQIEIVNTVLLLRIHVNVV
jgi:hypothetical protein